MASASKTDLSTMQAVSSDKGEDVITLHRGMADIIHLPPGVVDILVADPSVVDVQALQADKLYVVGLEFGSTNILAVDAQGNIIKRETIHVGTNSAALQSVITELFPDENIRIGTNHGRLVLSGMVSTQEVANRIVDLAARHVSHASGDGSESDAYENIANNLVVRSEDQVTLNVKIMEVSRTTLREIATDWSVDGIGTDLANRVEVLNPAMLTNLLRLTGVAAGTTSGTLNGGRFGDIDFVAQYLLQKGHGKILAEPTLTAISGQDAGFHAGGEIRYFAGRDDTGVPIIEDMLVGVALNFRPQVLARERIRLTLETEVAERADELGVTIDGAVLPGRTVRRATTTVEMGSGSVMMIAGLIQSEMTKNLTGIPGISDLPIIGQLVKSDSFNRNETEVLIMVSPLLVRPIANKERAEMAAKDMRKPLATAFMKNMSRTYARRLSNYQFPEQQNFGYLLD